jgi:hypothetical protein
MVSDVVSRFMQALREAEVNQSPAPLLPLFTEDAELHSLGIAEPRRGLEEIERFWRDYLSVFKEIYSEFTRIRGDEEGAVLEWVSEGTLSNGEPIRYRGVSILELEAGRIQRLSTYFDSAAFLPELPHPRPPRTDTEIGLTS